MAALAPSRARTATAHRSSATRRSSAQLSVPPGSSPDAVLPAPVDLAPAGLGAGRALPAGPPASARSSVAGDDSARSELDIPAARRIAAVALVVAALSASIIGSGSLAIEIPAIGLAAPANATDGVPAGASRN